jgi:casein kinase II subunit beta
LFFDTYNWDQPVPFKGVLATMGVFEDPDTPRSEIPQISLDADMPHEHGGKRKCYARVYTPRIYGFKVSERARSGPRMAWLRDRPDNYAGLETVDWRGRWKEEAQGGAAGEGKAAAGQDKVEASSALFEEDEVKSDNEEEDEEEE